MHKQTQLIYQKYSVFLRVVLACGMRLAMPKTDEMGIPLCSQWCSASNVAQKQLNTARNGTNDLTQSCDSPQNTTTRESYDATNKYKKQ